MGMGFQTWSGVSDMGMGFQTRDAIPDMGMGLQTLGWVSRQGVGVTTFTSHQSGILHFLIFFYRVMESEFRKRY